MFKRSLVNGAELEYVTAGAGDPVVMIHGGLLAEENALLLSEPALTNHHLLINYHRRGFAGSDHPAGYATIADQAADCRVLLSNLDIDRAHVMGHSLGGTIAIEVALQAPDLVQTLVLMEPAIIPAIARARASDDPDVLASQVQMMQSMLRVRELFEAGDRRGALTAFLDTRAGDTFRGALDYLTARGEFEQAIKDADTFLGVEIPAAIGWPFNPERAAQLKMPVLSMLGVRSPERPQLAHRALTEWVPQTELVTLPDAEHAMPLFDPPGIARVLAGYFARHPIKSGASA